MKRIAVLLAFLGTLPIARLHADPATDERLNQLAGKIEDLIAGQEAQRKRIADLAREIDSLREQAAKPVASPIRPEDLSRLADAIKEVDRKRQDDYEKTSAALLKLSKVAAIPPSKPLRPDRSTTSNSDRPPSDKIFEYTVQPGDTLDAIILAYKEKNIRVTVAQILAANPGLVPEKMKPGQKITIPAP
jgi:hypothetical protein